MVVACSLLVDVSVRGGMLTMTSSSWRKKVITHNFLFMVLNLRMKTSLKLLNFLDIGNYSQSSKTLHFLQCHFSIRV
jgi:hypothetical protein